MSPDTFITSDFPLTVALLSLNFVIDTIDRTDPHRALFVFSRTPEILEAVDNYWKKTLQIEPQTYFQNFKLLKTRLYNHI